MDRDLVERARSGDQEAFADLVHQASDTLFGVARRILRRQIDELEPQGKCALIGGGTAPPDSAAFYNGALVRYLDFNDAYLAKDETCQHHDPGPTGNVPPGHA